MLAASTSLIFGAKIGPEAAIMDFLGGLSTLVGDITKAFGAQFNLPEQVKSHNRIAYWLRRWPTIIAFLAGGIVFVRLLDGLYSGGIFGQFLCRLRILLSKFLSIPSTRR